jgi:NADPH:quinone reductase-like Zn-dependent oxidoreductase
MKAVQFEEYGDADVLHVVEVDEPHAGPGQVRIKVVAAGVNAMDWKTRAGYLKDMMPLTFPARLGLDAAGVVDEVGADVVDAEVGDAVFGSGNGTYAEYAVLDFWAAKPAALSFEEAAGYPLPVETAMRVLDQVGVQPGQTLLVSGASGGVGSAVLQIARARGISVIGTAGAANQDYVRALGATPTTYGDGLVQRVRALAPHGVDAALDLAGSGVVTELIDLTGDPAKVLSIADFSAPEHGAQVSTTSVNQSDGYAEAARMFSAGELSIPVQQRFPLDQAAQAQSVSAGGHVVGRLVLTAD